MLSHFRPIVLVKTLGHDIYSAAGDSFFILFVYPVTMSHRVPSWMYKQTIALWDDLRLVQSFIPTFGRLMLRFVGIFILFFFIAPYLIRNLVLRPLKWMTTTKKLEVPVRPRGTAGIYDIPDRMLERMMRDARAAFPDIPPTPIADEPNRGGNNNRRNRRRL
ncbi:hypothetical protein EIP86_000980 [Pleurotus ostreatoroseus]|nr:hypothetical protein EIP86_000980 [Pleurotus ostreatoroseus]